MCNEIIAVSNRKMCKKNTFFECINNVIKDKAKYLILREKDLDIEDYIDLVCDVKKYMGISYTKIVLNLGNVRNEEDILKIIEATDCKNIHIPIYIIDKINDFRMIRGKVDILGVPIHSKEEALLAESVGADYITAGHIFETDCKKGFPPRGLDFLRGICKRVNIDVYGIGGINRNNANDVIKAGAKGICIMSGYFK